jgi:hypothetical protein
MREMKTEKLNIIKENKDKFICKIYFIIKFQTLEY